jgi:hypothetical protein
MEKKFRVLVIDDAIEIVNSLRIERALEQKRREYEGQTWAVEVFKIHVQIDRSEAGIAQISLATFLALAEACTEPIRLMFLDYGYVHHDVRTEMTKLNEERRKSGLYVGPDDVRGKVLTTPDLVASAKRFVAETANDPVKIRNLERNFLHTKAKIYVYSYTSEMFMNAVPPMEARINETKDVFPLCEVLPIDTRVRFYNEVEFDYPADMKKRKHDKEFYAHLVAEFINQYIQRELLELLLFQKQNLRFVRVMRTTRSVAIVAALGGALGFLTEWAGSCLAEQLYGGHLAISAKNNVAD